MAKIKFMELYLKDEALLKEIDDYIEEWHNNDSDETIYDFLGMTEEKYGLWVESNLIPKYIEVKFDDSLQA